MFIANKGYIMKTLYDLGLDLLIQSEEDLSVHLDEEEYKFFIRDEDEEIVGTLSGVIRIMIDDEPFVRNKYVETKTQEAIYVFENGESVFVKLSNDEISLIDDILSGIVIG